ncbi:hypothetical protein CaLGV004 [Clostera anastomosis granulovirus A]|uniref:Uncharacterized protein n=1 Tax=Clostera anastomosis granulovirus A TaxID=1986289 RepID=U5KBJ9_9BBAC|nr:hypothetical protein CaLGV004 [Clostera anastomosis granulovirus Henan]AGQ20263.1 hypothetical protein CaLGV004 [Clostera anastomosis granulovirus Henan]
MLSLIFDDSTVYYNFDDVLRSMMCHNFEQADKKALSYDRIKVVCANEQVFVTNGSDIDVRLVLHDECYVNLEGVYELMDTNTFGDAVTFESMLVTCTTRVVRDSNHPWVHKCRSRQDRRVCASFRFYFNVLEQYMMAGQPHVQKIGPTINSLIAFAEERRRDKDYNSQLKSCDAFDKASALMLQNMG